MSFRILIALVVCHSCVSDSDAQVLQTDLDPAVAYEIPVVLKTTHLKPMYLHRRKPNISTFGTNDEQRLPIHQSIFEQQSFRAYQSLQEQFSDVEDVVVPRIHQNRVLAKWNGDFRPVTETNLINEESFLFQNRQVADHFELVWTGEVFEIRQYRDLDRRSRKCSPSPPALWTDSIELTPIETDTGLILTPTNKGIHTHCFVEVNSHGMVRVKLGTADVDSQNQVSLGPELGASMFGTQGVGTDAAAE